jgi:hypothetical protein
VPTVLAAGVAMLITRLRGNGPRVDLGLVWSWHDVRAGLAYGIGGLVVTIPASLLYVVLVGPGAGQLGSRRRVRGAAGRPGRRAGRRARRGRSGSAVRGDRLPRAAVGRAGALRAAALGAVRGDDAAVRPGPLRVHAHAPAVRPSRCRSPWPGCAPAGWPPASSPTR